jgi:hypothetical protein
MKKRKPGSFLLSMIAKARAELPRDVSELSDAELIRSMARGLSDFLREAVPNSSDDDDFAALACMFALNRVHAGYHRSEGEDAALAVAEDLLAELDLEFDPKQLRTIWRSDAFAEFRERLHQFGPQGPDDRPNEEIAVWCAGLGECARRACGVAIDFSQTSRRRA